MNTKNIAYEYAIWYAEQGIYVNALRPNSKVLIGRGQVLEMATRNRARISELFEEYPDRNIGIVTGSESNLIVIDIDVKNGARGREALAVLEERCGPLPKTLREVTPSGGEHLLFHLGDAEIPNGKLVINDIPGIDVFGRPHNVVVTPSIIDGKHYQHLERCGIAALPNGLADLLRTNLMTPHSARRTNYEEGSRNDGMFREACCLRRLNVADDEAWDKLRALNNELCTPPLNEAELQKIFASAWNYSAGYPHSDLGNCQRFFDRQGMDLRLVSESKRWLHFNGLRFMEDQDGETLRRLKTDLRRSLVESTNIKDSEERKAAAKWALQSENARRIQAIISLVPSELGVTVHKKNLDADPWLLATMNKIIDLRAGHSVTPLRAQLITKAAGAMFDSEARCPLWLKFLTQILPNADVRTFLKRFIGYSLSGDVREQCMLVLWGAGANGKTTFVETILELLGDYGAKTSASTWLQKRESIPNDLAALAGVRLVVSSELENEARLAASLVKGAIGQETLSARFLYGEWFTFRPQFKILLATNHRPSIDGGDFAMTRRLRLVPFTVTILERERDLELPQKLRTELSGIFNWALEGCLEWQQHGLGFPDEIRHATSEYARECDPLGLFLQECCETAPEYSTAVAEVYSAYEAWCISNRLQPHPKQRLSTMLKERGFSSTRTSSTRKLDGLRVKSAKGTPHEY